MNERITFFDLAHLEACRAAKLHPWKNAGSLHEGYAILLEEVEEFWTEVKKKRERRDYNAIHAELVQIAAMAARIAQEIVEPELLDSSQRRRSDLDE
jgi:hypothetical protein